jgi:CheY-like chemotaxis protein
MQLTETPGQPDRSASPGAGASLRTQVGGIVVLFDPARRTRSRAAAALRRAGYEVVLAAEGRVAREIIDDVMPDLLVCAATGRATEGLRLVEELRADPTNEHTALLLIADPTTTEEAIARRLVEPEECSRSSSTGRRRPVARNTSIGSSQSGS